LQNYLIKLVFAVIKTKIFNIKIKHFVIFITTVFFISCSKKYQITKIEGTNIGVSTDYSLSSSIETFVKPYREHIEKDLDSILAYNPETLDKSKGQWQTNIGNFMADVCFERASFVFEKRHQQKIDVCLLNHGGIRSILPKGNVTTRTAFEVMPFENNLMVIALKGDQIREMAEYLLKEKKPHPLSGIKIYFNSELKIKAIVVGTSPLDLSKTYYVATSDYLSNGGDNMIFFQKNEGTFDLDYKIRNVLIDHFKEVDTLKVSMDKRIIVE